MDAIILTEEMKAAIALLKDEKERAFREWAGSDSLRSRNESATAMINQGDAVLVTFGSKCAWSISEEPMPAWRSSASEWAFTGRSRSRKHREWGIARSIPYSATW